ncbi:hypothetical protein C8J57DRAFT_1509318 [Mycena rebaudengoi]|nr:hypothetical protein C8J57DRAFT_1509318 [Mycena rebaudengoi]
MADSKDIPRNRSFLSEIHNQISEVDACILALAHRERDSLQSRLDDYKYPVLTLPVEITSEISLLISRCPQSWREIAFDTPSLWRAIKLHIQNYSLDAQLIVLKTWLSRSKRCSLFLAFAKSYPLKIQVLPHFINTLSTHSARLEYIKLSLPFDELDCLEGPFPVLRELTIVPYSPGARPPAPTLFDDAPQLRSVVLGANFYRCDTDLPWSQITHITTNNIPPHGVVRILLAATGVVNLRCSLQDDYQIHSAIPPLFDLKSLILYDSEYAAPNGRAQELLLDALTAQALRHLLVSEPQLGHQLISTITSFLS